MPKLTKSTRKRNIKRLTQDVAEANGSFAVVARKYGVSRQSISKKMKDPKNRCIIQELLSDDKFKRALISVGLQGMQATKTIGAAIMVDKDGKVTTAEEQGVIEVDDHHARHKFWRDFLKAMGFLGDGVNINLGDKHVYNNKKIMIVRSPKGRHHKKKTVDVKGKIVK